VAIGIVAEGRYTRIEVFEIEDAAAALARFAELGGEGVPSPSTDAKVK
jgi:hypothetical protein